jgi:hypothetical protein
VYVHDWEELRKRHEFDFMQAYGAAALQPSTFIPTQPVVPQQVKGCLGGLEKSLKGRKAALCSTRWFGQSATSR